MSQHKNKSLSSRDGRQRNVSKTLARISDENLAELNQAYALLSAGDPKGAEALAEKALLANPGHLGLRSLLGQLALLRGNYAAAVAHLDAVLPVYSENLPLRAYRACAWQKLGENDKADPELDAILALDPRQHMALKARGSSYAEKKEFAQAEDCFKRAMEAEPNDPDGLTAYAKFLIDTERDPEAMPYLKRAIKLNPKRFAPFHLLGAIYRGQCRFRVAFSYLRHAHRLDPDDIATNMNLAMGLMDVGRVHESVQVLRACLEKKPDFHGAQFNLANVLLLIGQLKEGWDAYEARREIFKMPERVVPYADWKGEPLKDKAIVILAEQGLGDEIWAASMFDDVIERAGHCVIQCAPRLVGLFTRSFPAATVIARHPAHVELPAGIKFDYKTLGMSLARWLRTSHEDFPGRVGYLVPDPVRTEFWRWRLSQLGAGLKVGISWRSLVNTGTRRNSYTTLDQWGAIFQVPGAIFVNLQYGESQAELDEAAALFGVTIHNFKDIDLKDGIEDVTALISEMDVVVAPDNTVGAIAGALDVPVLQFVPSTYWSCLGKDYNPWYPSARVFFRPWDRDWSAALGAIATDLQRRVHQKLQEDAHAAKGSEDETAILQHRIGRGALLLLGRQVEKARDICEQVLSLRPDHPDALILLAAVEKFAKQYGLAEKALRRAIALEPLYAEAYNHLGALFLESGRASDAVLEFTHALELRPNYADALNNLGNAHAAMREFDQAIECYQRAIAAFAGYVTARYNYALVLEDVGRIDEAIVEYETVVEANNMHFDAWNNLGNLYGRLQRNEEAKNAYRMALRANPELMIARTNLAKKILAAGGDIDEALEHLKAAAAARPEDAQIANNLGAAHAMKGDMETAAGQFEKAVSLKPDYADAYRNLGLALQQLGRLGEARDALLKGIQLMTGAAENPPGNDATIPKLLH